MNDDARDDATDQPVSLNNEATLDVAVFAGTNPIPTAASGAASNIVSDAHIPPSGQKQHTKPFYPVNMDNMAKKDTIDTIPAPESPTTALADASARYSVLIVSNSPYSLRNSNFPTSSISTKTP